MPKFVCMEYSAGTSSFDVTYSVTADTNGKFGRNFLFAGAGVPTSRAALLEHLGRAKRNHFTILNSFIVTLRPSKEA